MQKLGPCPLHHGPRPISRPRRVPHPGAQGQRRADGRAAIGAALHAGGEPGFRRGSRPGRGRGRQQGQARGSPPSSRSAIINDDDIDFSEGTVKEIRPLATSIKGAVYYDAVITVQNRKDPTTQDWQLRPGMTASVDIVRYEHKNVWRVPTGAFNFTLEEAYQSESAKARVAEWKQRPDAKDWQTLWTWDLSTQRPQPLMVRLNPKKGRGRGLKGRRRQRDPLESGARQGAGQRALRRHHRRPAGTGAGLLRSDGGKSRSR